MRRAFCGMFGAGSLSLGLIGSFFVPTAVQALPVVSPEPPAIDDGDTFGLYVGDQETYDSNIFRVPPALEAALVGPNASREDYINTSSVGGDGQFVAGRQVFDADFQLNDKRFARNDSLNNVGGFGRVVWNWTLASKFSGQIRASYDRDLAGFAEAIYYGRDVVATQDYSGQGAYQIGPHWAIFGDVHDTTYSHSAEGARINDYRNSSGSAGVELSTSSQDYLRAEYRYSDGYYPTGYIFNNAVVNRDFHENIERVLIKYAVTNKTLLDAYAGYLQRKFTEEALGNFAGVIWRASLDWQPTDKTDLMFAAWRELHSYASSEADYFVSRGGSLTPAWTVSEKLTLSAAFSYENQAYIASSNSVILIGSRTDKITGEQLNALYKPRSNLLLNIFVRNEVRKSDQERFQYNDLLVNASITFRFW